MDAVALYTETESDPHRSCATSRSPLPILELRGTDDKTAAYYDGSRNGQELSDIPDVLRKWAVHNNCGATPFLTINSVNNKGVYYTQYDCAGKVKAVIGYNVTAQRHDWISKTCNNDNTSKDGNSCNTASVDTSKIMMSFFNENSNPWPGLIAPCQLIGKS